MRIIAHLRCSEGVFLVDPKTFENLFVAKEIIYLYLFVIKFTMIIIVTLQLLYCKLLLLIMYCIIL